MSNTIKEKIMVSSINDLNKMKAINPERRLKANQEETLFTDIAASTDVSISGESKHLEALKASLRDVPEINEARVMYFKAEIEAGTYEIRSDKIARNMLNNVEMA